MFRDRVPNRFILSSILGFLLMPVAGWTEEKKCDVQEEKVMWPDGGHAVVCVKDGRKHGPVVHYGPFGNVIFEGEFRKDELDGPTKRYHANGKVHREGVYKDGKLHGLWKSYDDTGRLESKGTWLRDMPHGYWQERSKDDPKEIRRGYFRHGQRVGQWQTNKKKDSYRPPLWNFRLSLMEISPNEGDSDMRPLPQWMPEIFSWRESLAIHASVGFTTFRLREHRQSPNPPFYEETREKLDLFFYGLFAKWYFKSKWHVDLGFTFIDDNKDILRAPRYGIGYLLTTIRNRPIYVTFITGKTNKTDGGTKVHLTDLGFEMHF